MSGIDILGIPGQVLGMVRRASVRSGGGGGWGLCGIPGMTMGMMYAASEGGSGGEAWLLEAKRRQLEEDEAVTLFLAMLME